MNLHQDCNGRIDLRQFGRVTTLVDTSFDEGALTGKLTATHTNSAGSGGATGLPSMSVATTNGKGTGTLVTGTASGDRSRLVTTAALDLGAWNAFYLELDGVTWDNEASSFIWGCIPEPSTNNQRAYGKQANTDADARIVMGTKTGATEIEQYGLNVRVGCAAQRKQLGIFANKITKELYLLSEGAVLGYTKEPSWTITGSVYLGFRIATNTAGVAVTLNISRFLLYGCGN